MMIMRIKGGLGNQLFQYATAYSLSKKIGLSLELDPSNTATMTARNFRIPYLNCSETRVVAENSLNKMIQLSKKPLLNRLYRFLHIFEHKCGDYFYYLETGAYIIPNLFEISKPNIYVDGYFQSDYYFKEYREELLKQFVPNYPPEESYIKVLNEIRSVNSVAVHVRRSDFKKDRCSFHYLLDKDYYLNSIEYMRNRLDSPVFFWFSDDMEWIKEEIGSRPDFRFVCIKTKHGDIDDLLLMKNCNHIITANSSFSWWAAWLNESEKSIKIVPKKPFGMDGMIPENWIKR